MHCTLYVLRRNGVKLSKEEVHATARAGWVEVARFRAPPVLSARWFEQQPSDASELQNFALEIDHVQIGIVRGGLLLKGLEIRGPYQAPLRQAWWVVPRFHG